MPPILIQPDNRLLGSASDLSLYGVQPIPGMSIGRPAEVRPDAQQKANSDSATAAPSDATAPPTIATEAIAPVDDEPTPTASHHSAGPAIVAAPGEAALSENDPIFSSGATSPSTLFSAPSHAVLPSGEAQQATTLTGAAADGALISPVLAPGAGLADSIGNVMGDAQLFAAVTETLGQVTDMLDGIAGIDPAAGIETIVDLMKTADIFELRAATGDVIDHGSAPILDALAFDLTVESPLLGDHDAHDDGLLGGLDTDHGLPGLG